MNFGVVFLWLILAVLLVLAVGQGNATVERALARAIKQFAMLVPRMVCAILASGFLAHLIPAEAISASLGKDAGFLGILIGTLAGLIIPAGPVIAFSIAAVFAQADASIASLFAFLTSWSVFAIHRVFIYELPLLGPTFLRMRIISVAGLPIVAGVLGLLVGFIADITPYGQF